MVHEDDSEMAGFEDGPGDGDGEISSHDKCNLIINYLPLDIDDATLIVRFIPMIFSPLYLCYWSPTEYFC